MNGDINLMPRVDTLPIKIKQEYRRWRMIWVVAAIVAVSFLVIAAHRRHQIESRVDSIVTVAAELNHENSRHLAHESYLAMIRQELTQSSPVPSGVDPFRVLELLVNAVEDAGGEDGGRTIEIDRLRVVPAENDGDVLVEISGSARNRRAISTLAEALVHSLKGNPPELTVDESLTAAASRVHPFVVRFVLPSIDGSSESDSRPQVPREAT